MPRSLSDQDVQAWLKGRRSTTALTGGRELPYPFPSPGDWRRKWIYFLLVDRFNNRTEDPRDDEPAYKYQGGNFDGILAQLDYLAELGAGALWLSPVLTNPRWFEPYWGGYGTQDLLGIEPRFCRDPAAAEADPELAAAEFRNLVDEAHARGLHVILDIVLNHVGDLFAYEGHGDEAPWNAEGPWPIEWRDRVGAPRPEWPAIENIPDGEDHAGLWPKELRENRFFRRRGTNKKNTSIDKGDFDRLKELHTGVYDHETQRYPVRDHLIRAYQFLIARFDLDGFRIDTLQYVEPEFARVFGNAMREFALSIGKENFFTFGEIWHDTDESWIARFVGRHTERDETLVGVDAAINFPLRSQLVRLCRAEITPEEIADHFDDRKEVLRKVVSSHGDAAGHYVSFLDNHDMTQRVPVEVGPELVPLALTCLMTMHGVPCLYYGTEQGLSGQGKDRESAREALWRGPDAFSRSHPLYQFVAALGELRSEEPALCFGRQYFRPVSGNGRDFGHSPYAGGILAYSRILNDREVLVVANPSRSRRESVYVLVDPRLNPAGRIWRREDPGAPADGAGLPTETRHGIHCVRVEPGPCEAWILV